MSGNDYAQFEGRKRLEEDKRQIVSKDNPMPVQLVDINGNTVVEQYSRAVVTIETEHARIHEGAGYQLSGEVAALAAGTSAYFLIDPDTPIHWRNYKFIADGAPVDIEFFENPTVTANGTLETAYNRNRLSPNVTSANIYSAPTVTADGTRLYLTRLVGTGTDKTARGESEGPSVEWVIDGGNTYLLKVTNNDAVAVNLVYDFFWYEA